jgi:hypothetical protein
MLVGWRRLPGTSKRENQSIAELAKSGMTFWDFPQVLYLHGSGRWTTSQMERIEFLRGGKEAVNSQ